MIHLTIVGVGLGAIFAISTLAFFLLQWAGVLYLVWIGASKLMLPKTQLTSESVQIPKSALFNRARVINVTNPKAFVFVAAFFPQFIDQNLDLLPQYTILSIR